MDTGQQPQTAVTWVYEHSKHTGNVYQVLRTLAIAYAEQGACLSVKEIAEQTRVSQTTVRTALKTLEQGGTIEVIKNGGTKRRNGVTNCYRLVGFQPGAARETPSETRGTQRDTPTPSYSTTPSSTPTQRRSTTPSYTPPANPVNAPVYVSDAAGEKDLSLRAKEKDKKHPLPAKAGKENAPEELPEPLHAKPKTAAGQEWEDLLGAIEDVFEAYKEQARNYANMLMGKAKKDAWGKSAFEEPVNAAELRAWWAWYQDRNPGIRVKQPALVYSAITAWRKAGKPQPPVSHSPAQQRVIYPKMTPEELDKIRPTASSGVIKIGEPLYVNRR